MLKEELRKMGEITAQTRYMIPRKIKTLEDLYADREKIKAQMNELIDTRTKLQNKIRRALPEAMIALRKEKDGVSAQIAELRKQLKLNEGIEKRSLKIQDNMDQFYANEERAKEAAKSKRQGDRVR